MMYQIALCDDETAELDKTEQLLETYVKRHPQAEFLVERFDHADKLLRTMKEQGYLPDLLLMDIYMPEKMGIDAARELRDMGNHSRIVFLTTSKEHALEAFRVDAAQYLVKPISQDMLFPVLDRFFGDSEEERRRYLVLRAEGRICRVAVSDIIYCEAQGKTQSMYLADGTQRLLRMTMAEIYEMLAQYEEFVRVGVTYIINLEFVENLNSQEICVSGGKRVYLPRGAYKTLKEQYFRYYCGEN